MGEWKTCVREEKKSPCSDLPAFPPPTKNLSGPELA
jgi:hypothetical protein